MSWAFILNTIVFIFLCIVLDFFIKTDRKLIKSMSTNFLKVRLVSLFRCYQRFFLFGKCLNIFVFFVKLFTQTQISKLNWKEKVLCSETVFTIFNLEICYVIVTNTCGFVVLSVKHVASLCKVNYSKHIWLWHKIVIWELLIWDKTLKQLIQIFYLQTWTLLIIW